MFKLKNFEIKKIMFGVVLGLVFFSINPISVYASRLDQMENDSTKVVQSNNAKDNYSRLQEYCTFWSAPSFSGCEALGEFDTEGNPDGSAPLVDSKNPENGRGNPTTKTFSEDVREYEGYYEYDIKLSAAGETDKDGEAKFLYTRRTYYKYYELKKEEKYGWAGSGDIIGDRALTGLSTGVWLYFASDKDQKVSMSKLKLIDVFTGLALDEDTQPYDEMMFLWVMSSEGVAVAGDKYETKSGTKNFQTIKKELTKEFGYLSLGLRFDAIDEVTQKKLRSAINKYNAKRNVSQEERVSAIKAHSCYDFGAISDPDNFELLYFSRNATREMGQYAQKNPECPLIIKVPNTEEVGLKVAQITGHLEYANSNVYRTNDRSYWTPWVHKEEATCFGVRSVMGGKNTLLLTNNKRTYPDLENDTWNTWFVRKTISIADLEKELKAGGYTKNNIMSGIKAGTFDDFISNGGKDITLCFNVQNVYNPALEAIGHQGLGYYNPSDTKKFAADSASWEDGSKSGFGDISYYQMFRNANEDQMGVMVNSVVNVAFWESIGLKPVEKYDRELFCNISKGNYPVMTLKEGAANEIPRACLRTLQVYLKTNNADCFKKFVTYVRLATDALGPIKCDETSSTDDIFKDLSISKMNELVENGEYQKVLEIYAIMFAASCEFIAWQDYACDGLATSFRLIGGDNNYRSFSSAIITENIAEQKAIKILMSRGNSIEVVDLYKAFGVSNNEMFEIAKVYKEGSKDGNILNVEGFKTLATTLDAKVDLSDEQLEMVLQALNGEQFTGALTETEITAGLVDMPIVNEQTKAYQKAKEKEEKAKEKAAESESENSENLENSNVENDDSDSPYSTGAMTELETSFVPYVTVVRRYNESEYEFDKEAFPDLIEYDGSNGEAVVEKIGMKI